MMAMGDSREFSAKKLKNTLCNADSFCICRCGSRFEGKSTSNSFVVAGSAGSFAARSGNCTCIKNVQWASSKKNNLVE